MTNVERGPIRVMVVAASLALRAGLRILLGAGGAIEVVGEAARLADLHPELPNVDVLVVEWEDGGWQSVTELVPILFLVANEVEAAQAFAGRPRRAWGLLPLDSSPEELQAAAVALQEGLIVGAPALLGPRFEQPAGKPPQALVEPLTEREVEVLQLLAQGLANKQIALALRISEHTVKFHVSAIYTKLGATNRTEAARIGVRQGLVVL